MRLQALSLLLVIATPIATFLLILNRDVALAPLDGVEARCLVCNRRATRTLKSAAESLRLKGVYIYDPDRYPGMPVWCDLHGPDKARENSRMAYLTALAVFAAAGVAYEKIRRSTSA